MNEKLILENAKRFLVNYLKNKEVDYEPAHPWRKDGAFRVQHSLRVTEYARKIATTEDLAPSEIFIIELASILHDIGALDDRENHTEKSYDIVNDWLSFNSNFGLAQSEIDLILEMIKEHSNKKDRDENIFFNILKDADILDEIGVMSILLATHRVDRNSSFFHENLRKKIEDFEIPFCDEKIELCFTQTAKQIIMEKKKYIKLFLQQLCYESEGSMTEEEYQNYND